MKNIIITFMVLISLLGNSKSQIPEATSGFRYPLNGSFSNNGGYKFLDTAYYSGNLVYHPGQDWNQPTLNGGCSNGCDIDRCLDVVAAADGQVKYVSDDQTWGGIVIQHYYQGQTWYSQYGHIFHKVVSVGQIVLKGQKIAEIGNVGTTCSHLHFEIREADHPNPTYGSYFQYGNNGIGNYNNVVNWYEDPDIFIPSHPAYSNSTVNCTYSVNSVYSLEHWKFWKSPPMPTSFYIVTLDITNLPSGAHWALYILNPNGNIISDVRTNRTETHYSFEFSVGATDPNYPNAFGYRFRLTPQGQQNTTWSQSEQFYISSLPSLSINIEPPLPLTVGTTARVTWSTAGGIPGLTNGGWIGNIRLQWYQNNVALSNLDSTLVSIGTYSFVVPQSIQGDTIPGNNFQIAGANADVGTSIPGGYVSAFTNNFSIQYPTGIEAISEIAPGTYKLYENYPNPFNPITNINFDIVSKGYVKLIVLDVLGQEVANLINEELQAGSYKIYWDATNYPSGVYFYKLEAGTFIQSKKMVLLK